jgi:predicted DNA-binding transcriptional regulator AlpA
LCQQVLTDLLFNIYGVILMETPSKILRFNAVLERLSISRSTLYRLINQGRLTQIKISDRATGILQSSVDDYINDLVSQAGGEV